MIMMHFHDTCNRTITFLAVETLHCEHYRTGGKEPCSTIDDVDPKVGKVALVCLHPNT